MKLLSLIFILSLTLTSNFNAQTVDLDNHKVHIGDSFESVKNQFDPKIYNWVTDSSNSSNWSYLFKYNDPKKRGGVESIAQLDFSADVNDFKDLIVRGYKYYLHSVMKYWDNGTTPQNGTNEFAQKIFNILQSNGIDKYSLDITTTKFPEKSADAKSISLKIHPNVKLKIEFNGKNNCILSETISKEEDTTSAQFVLLYFDTKNLFGKDKIISNVFSSEKEALAKKNEFDMEYAMKNYLPPRSQIVRFCNEKLIELPILH